MARATRTVYQGFVDIARQLIVRWDDGLPGEPAHGLFLRIAGLNYQTSVRVFADSLGINGLHLQPTECRQILSKVRVGNWDEVDRWTPVFEGKRVRVAGQVFMADHWSIGTRRHCPACLAESAHHRTWWDLVVMSRCPFHDLDIVDTSPGGAAVGWWFSGIDAMPDGESLARHGVARDDRPTGTWEAWVLGRMGLAPRFDVPGLDVPAPEWPAAGRAFEPVDLDVAFEVASLLGRLVLAGWSKVVPDVGGGRKAASEVVSAGFACLVGGQKEVDRCLARVVAGGPAGAYGYEELLGWVADWLHWDERRRIDVLMRAIVRALREDGRFAEVFPGSFPDIGDRALSVAGASRVLGLARSNTRQVLARNGLLDLTGDAKRKRLRRTVTDVDGLMSTIEERRRRTVSRTVAAGMLGVGREAIVSFVRGGLLESIADRWSEEGDGAPLLVRDSVERLLTAAVDGRPSMEPQPHLLPLFDLGAEHGVDPADILRAVLSREIRVEGCLADRPGLSSLVAWPTNIPVAHPLMLALRRPHNLARTLDRASGATRSEAALTLGTSMATIGALLRAGLLKPVPGSPEGLRQPLTRESLDEIARDYVTATECSRGSDLTASSMTVFLRKVGVLNVLRDVPRTSGKVTAFYRREDVRQVLGTSFPDPDGDATHRDFWNGFGAYLNASEALILLQSFDGPCARFQSPGAYWRYEVDFGTGKHMRIYVLLSRKDERGRGREALRLWRAWYGNLRGSRPQDCSVEGDMFKFDTGFLSSLPREMGMMLGPFRRLFYRCMLLEMERGRIFFEHAEGDVPGQRPHVAF